MGRRRFSWNGSWQSVDNDPRQLASFLVPCRHESSIPISNSSKTVVSCPPRMALPGPWNSLKGFPAETSKWRSPLKQKDLVLRRRVFAVTLAILLCASSAILFGQDAPGAPGQAAETAPQSPPPQPEAASPTPAPQPTTAPLAPAPQPAAAPDGQAGLEGGDGREAEIRE